jgi:hypothetical protein
MRPISLFLTLVAVSALLAQRGANSPFPGGTNPDGSLRPTAPVTQYFTQDAYTEYSILAPGTEQFRVKFLPEESRPGATELVNATRGGSEGSDVEVFDPRTGEPMEFTYKEDAPEVHAIHAKFKHPVPPGGIGRVLIYKTYKDARTYMMHGQDIVWVRSLAGYRLGVVLPKGFSFISSNVAAQLGVMPDGRLRLMFANPSGQSNPVTIHARPTTTAFQPGYYVDMFYDDMKTLYDLGAPDSHSIHVDQIYSDYRKGPTAKLDSLQYLDLKDLKVTDLDTAETLPVTAGSAKLAVPIKLDEQSAHLKISGTLNDATYRADKDDFTFERTMKGLRNTVILPAGYEVESVSQSGTIGQRDGRQFVSLINLNTENSYRVTIRAHKSK